MAIDKSPLTGVVKQHFASLGNQQVTVPEWSKDAGEPLALFFDPVTVAERIELGKVEDDSYLIAVIIMKAKLPDGKPAFTLADEQMLKTAASPLIISRIANRILNADAIDPKALKKSSATASKTESLPDLSTTSQKISLAP